MECSRCGQAKAADKYRQCPTCRLAGRRMAAKYRASHSTEYNAYMARYRGYTPAAEADSSQAAMEEKYLARILAKSEP